MKLANKALRLSAVFFLAIPLILPGRQKDGGTTALSLRECLVQALANNLSLTVEALNPDIQEAAVAATREAFLPELGASFYRQSLTSLGVWGVQGTSYPFRSSVYGFSLSQKFTTGTSAVLSVNNSTSTTGQKYTVINPAYLGTIELVLTQPLLKGFGPKVNRAPTVQAQRQLESVSAALKARVLQVIYDTEQAYWNLYSDIESLKVQESSLEQSREVLRRAKEGERIGNQSALDVLNAETSVAGWEDGSVSARQRVEQSESALRKLLSLPASVPGATGSLAPTDMPNIEPVQISYDDALAAALVHRPEIVQAEKQLAISISQVGYQANQVLPQLNLTLYGWSQGQSGVKYIYENGDPINGALLETIVGSRWDAFKQALKGTFKSWSASIDLTFPLANAFSRALLTQARLQEQQSLADLETQRQAAAFEITDALKQLRNAELRMQSSAANRALQEKRLAASIQRYQLGLVDIQWLFEYQRQLATARTSEVQALIDYRIAAARLNRAMGTTLESEGLKFRDYAF